MDLIQQNQNTATMEVEQMCTMREWAIQRLPDKMLPLIKDIDDITDIPKMYTNALKMCGFKKIILLPHYDDIDEEWYHKPMFAMTALCLFIGHNDSKDVVRCTLKEHQISTGKELMTKLQRGGKCPPPIIFHEGLTEANFKQTKYISFSSAKFLIDTDCKKDIYKAKAQELSTMCNDIIEIIPRLFKKMNRIVAEYRHKDQVRELQEIQQRQEAQEQKNKEEQERLRVMRIELAYNTCPDKQPSKTHKVYIFSSPEYLGKIIPMVKVGITDDVPKRLKQHQTSCPTGKIYFEVDTYDSKGAEQALLNMYRSYGLAIKDKNSSAEEWIKVSSLERTKERLKLVAEHRNGEYEDLSDECQLIREMIVGEQEPFIVDGQNYIEYKEPEDTEPEDINTRVITRFIQEKLKEDIELNYEKLSDFKKDFSKILKYFKRDSKYCEIPNEIEDVLKLFEDDERVIFEVKKKRNTKTVRMTTKSAEA